MVFLPMHTIQITELLNCYCMLFQVQSLHWLEKNASSATLMSLSIRPDPHRALVIIILSFLFLQFYCAAIVIITIAWKASTDLRGKVKFSRAFAVQKMQHRGKAELPLKFPCAFAVQKVDLITVLNILLYTISFFHEANVQKSSAEIKRQKQVREK